MKKFSIHTGGAVLLAMAVFPVLAATTPSHDEKGTNTQLPNAESSITHGTVVVEGQRINYEAKTGILILRNKEQKPIASMSYIAYFKSGVSNPASRPITFFYNGGPGSSTVWLHMLAFGPKLVKVGNGTLTPPAPYKLVNNDYSLLDATDEVFIDAPGTGFGRVIGKAKGGAGTPKDVFGIDQDAHAFAQFITRFLTANNRWTSPKYLFGESYGTMRNAVLANILDTDESVGLNGMVFLSSVLNWNLMVDSPQLDPGINLPYALGLPTYAATAWYHDKLQPKPKNLQAFLKEVERFATGSYLTALNRGDQLDSATKRQIARKMHEYTGLPTAYILKANLRVTGGQFAHELLSARDEVTGRLDSRFTGPAMDPLGEEADYDPLNSIGAATVAEFNSYVRNTLKFGKRLIYKPFIDAEEKWNFKHPAGLSNPLTTPNVMRDLAVTMKFDPNMKVMLAGGYFDLGTTFYSAEYEMHQLGLPEGLRKNISYKFFQSGHMVYLNPTAHKSLHDAVAKFIESSYKH